MRQPNIRPVKRNLEGFTLHKRDADRLRKDINNKWKRLISGEVSAPGMNPQYLVAKGYFLTEIAVSIHTYSRWIKGKSLQLDDDEVQHYRKLIELVRKMMP